MLNEKDKPILRTIIDLYVGDAVPVSSQRVHDSGRFRMSTATIRNRMVVLEREGFIAKAHVSSGRIPTDEGYRAYVDELQAGTVRPRGDGLAAVREELRDDLDVNGVMQRASQLLGALSQHVAVVYGAIVQESRVRTVRLLRLEGAKIIVVVHLIPDYERTVTLRLGRDVAAEAVAAAERLLDRMVAGRSLQEARARLAEMVRDNVTDEGIVVGEIALRRDDVFSEPVAVELCFEEPAQMLAQPELSDPRTLQLLLRILHDRGYLTSILADRRLNSVEVTIGSEHRDDTLRPFSLVTAGYRMGAARGVLGLIGPTRMRYDLALGLVESMSRELCAIGDERF
ncbi:MAG TPA: heat-inducible transcriptional repressor HrcA [Candidatus Krumholzibacteria bacterium]|nr:heat-inducible transcriptional repressor HrcA [Candidatus Krumholzibacteria bacterium]